jgi:hypothetical protein
MAALITGAATWVVGDRSPGALRADLLGGVSRLELELTTPARPAGVPSGTWRRMSRLARMAMALGSELLEPRPDLDHDTLAVVWGCAIGEVVPTGRFLERLFTEGPDRASPLNFQNSVYNAPAGHLSIAMGLKGMSETVAAGGATGLIALMRGLDILALDRAPAVLVIAGDDHNPVTTEAHRLGGTSAPIGEAVAAILLEKTGDGVAVEVSCGVDTRGMSPVFARQSQLPDEPPIRPVPGAHGAEHVIGLSMSMGLALVVAASAGGGVVVDQEGDAALTARIGG